MFFLDLSFGFLKRNKSFYCLMLTMYIIMRILLNLHSRISSIDLYSYENKKIIEAKEMNNISLNKRYPRCIELYIILTTLWVIFLLHYLIVLKFLMIIAYR